MQTPKPGANHRQLLLVDDEPAVVESTRFILECEGYQVLVAGDGVEALAILRRERPSIVLLDVMIPHLDGYSVCRAIRQDAALAGTYVIVLTARGQHDEERRAKDAGADAYFRKPFDDDALLVVIAQAFAAAG
jgi:two-component system alkaline phosphatase synthesis response regulator PhoP